MNVDNIVQETEKIQQFYETDIDKKNIFTKIYIYFKA